jgi:hypothetical protein
MAAAPSPVVHPEDFYITSRFSRSGFPDDPQDRIGGALNAQLPSQPVASLATQGAVDHEQGIAIATGLSAIGPGHDRQSSRKDPALTIAHSAIETMGAQADPDHRATARQVAQGTAIPAVYVTRTNSAMRTRRATCGGGHDHDDNAALMNDFIQHQACWIWKVRYGQGAGGGSHLPFEIKTFFLKSVLSRNGNQPPPKVRKAL